MKLAGLMSRSRPELPGLVGIARVDRRTENLLRRLKPGDIAVIDQVDLDRATADALVAAQVKAVVNAAPSISGRYPNLGPSILVDAGITLVDRVGPEVMITIKDGSRIRIDGGEIFAGELKLAEGTAQDADSVADALVEAKAGLSHQLEAFAANTTEFMQRERQLLLDGDGVPEVEVELANRQVLVVAAGYDHTKDLAALRSYIREYRPVLVGVGAGADALLEAGHTPDLVVANPEDVSDRALTCGADIVVPAEPDGHAPGLARVQDLGVGAVTFPSSANQEDLALLLAAHHDAALVVTVGMSATMAEFLDRGRSGSNASTFLTRLQLGAALVDGRVIAMLYRSRISAGMILLLVAAGAAAVLGALVATNIGDAALAWFAQTWDTVVAPMVETIKGWFA
ncbi:putative cytokinetic ring protein SteA [Pseudonocardia thermophila]|jgi:Uncharacterized membrane-anchored protein conserved in bacteria|uniref:putative cytokinetic ring protein SteA n=1 Tax=Pseudonocardia thermophila TaxID=1848 RepID=UPI00248EBEB5|nr:putative cytokinetic ring protein SteA [Pseudonocardia thermophila]